MRRFTDLYAALDASTKTNAKLAALVDYFRDAPAGDAAWATFFLTGRRLKRLVRSRDLREAAFEAARVPEWLFNASYDAVGDLAETIALLIPPATSSDDGSLAHWVEQRLAPLAGLPPEDVKARLAAAWDRLDRTQRFVFNKLITGEFRVGVARQLVAEAVLQLGPEVLHLDPQRRDVAGRLEQCVRRPLTTLEHRLQVNLANRNVDLVHRAPPFAVAW